MESIINKIREELTAHSRPDIRQRSLRFFKESIQCYGVKGPEVRDIAKKYWSVVKEFDKKEIFKICEELFKSDLMEEAGICALWIPKLKIKFEEKDLEIFRRWIEKYINNWAKCDGFCNHTIGDYLSRYPKKIQELKSWARSKNRWMRRAAAVSLIVPARKGEFLEDIYEIASILLEDKDDMVQKGYGWMLKEASRKHREEIFQYVLRNRKKMPRTALRYSIELMPKEYKVQAMKRE